MYNNDIKRKRIKLFGIPMLLIVFLIAIAIIIPLNFLINKTVVSLKEKVIDIIENKIERKITYSSISPSIFQYLEIRNLTIYDSSETEEKTLLKLSKVRITFNILTALFSEKTPFTHIYLENSSIDLDTVSDRNIIDIVTELSGINEKNTGKNSFLVNKLSISGKNISIRASSGNGNFTLKKLFVDLKINKDLIDFTVKSRLLGDNLPFKAVGKEFSCYLAANGSIDRIANRHNYILEIKEFKNSKIRILKQTVSVQYNDNIITFKKIRDREPIDLFATYNLDNGIFTAGASVENYIPSKTVKFLAKSRFYSFLDSPITGNLDIIYNRNLLGNKLSYTAHINTIFNRIFIPFRNKIEATITGTEHEISFSPISFKTAKGDISYTGEINLETFLPTGSLQFKNIVYKNKPPLSGDAFFQADSLSDRTNAGVNADINMSFENSENIPIAIKTRFVNETYYFDLSTKPQSGGIASIIGTYRSSKTNNQKRLEMKVETEKLPISYIFMFAPPLPYNPKNSFLKERIIDFSLNFSTNFKNFNAYTDNFTLSMKETGKSFFSASFEAKENNIVFPEIIISSKNINGSGEIAISRTEDLQYSGSANFIINNEFYDFNGKTFTSGLLITGNHNFHLGFFPDQEKERTVFSIFSKDMPLPLYNMLPKLSLRISGFYDKEGNTKVYMRDITLKNIGILSPNNAETSFLSFTSWFDGSNFRTSKLIYRDDYSYLSGKGDFFNNGIDELYGWVSMNSSTNYEKYLFHVAYNNNNLNIAADITNVPIDRFTGEGVTGKVTGTVNLFEYPKNPRIYANFALLNGILDGIPFSLDLSLNADSSGILLENFDLDYSLSSLKNGFGYIDRTLGVYNFSTNLSLQETFSTEAIESDFFLSGNLSESAKVETNILNYSAKDFISGKISIENMDNDIIGFNKWKFSYINNSEMFSLAGGPSDSISASIDKAGNFMAAISNPFPVTGFLKGTIIDGEIDALFEDFSLDFDVIKKLVGVHYFVPYIGTAKGTLHIIGKLNDPDIIGQLHADSVMAESVFAPDKIGPFSTVINFDGKGMHIPETRVPIQKAFALVELDIVLDHWLPRNILFKLRTEPGSTLRIKSVFSAVELDGYASGKIEISQDMHTTTILGSISANRCSITLSGKDIGEEEDKLKKDLLLNLDIISGSGVEFYWPSVTVPIVKTIAATGQKINVFYDRGSYLISGDIKIQGGEIYYFNQSFYLQEGNIVFNENENKFDPLITARAELRERTSDNQEVKISLILENSPLSKFSPRFTSQPLLSENDIYALLGQSIYNQLGGDELSFGTAVLATSSYYNFLGLLRPIENEIKKLLNLDLFTIRTQFLENVLLGEVLSFGNQLYPKDSGFATYLDNSSIFLGKYFGEYFFLKGLLKIDTMDFDTYQYSYYDDIQDYKGIYLQTEISLEVDTPLFLLGLSLYPRYNDFFRSLSDTTLQLSWRFNF